MTGTGQAGDVPTDVEGVGSGAAPTVVAAPAKLTVSLRLTGVRPDGYHLLDAEMVALELADSLLVTEGDGLEVSLDGLQPPEHASSLAGHVSAEQPPGVPPGDDNLVRRALAAVGRRAHVVLVKRIPPGAGLGGGSADAAAVLRWAGCDDLGVAARLGADVPFCVVGGRARVTGVGEQVAPLPFVDRSFVLLLPPFGVDTAAVYHAFDELVAGRGARWRRTRTGTPDVEAAVNELEEAALVVDPRLAAWRDALADATGVQPRLAGSGSTWFVEGSAAELGLADVGWLTVGGASGRVVATRTVPSETDGTGVVWVRPEPDRA